MRTTVREYESPKGRIRVYRLENEKGAWVELSSLGAGIIGVGVPDRNGKIENIALGYADPADYLYDGPCLGKCPGRYANRIARGHLVVEGIEYKLAINNGPNALHGGPDGFQNRIWDAREIENGVEFTYTSADGEENYPGNLTVKAIYTWDDSDTLILRFEAQTDKATVVNMTNHSYWNLNGADSGTVLGHEMSIKADEWLPTDETLIPLPEAPAPVEGTPMDFRTAKEIGRDINSDFAALKYGKGYDNCWVIREWEPGRLMTDAVVLTSKESGRRLRIDTDQPGVQVYTGNWLAGSPLNRSGKPYEDYDGVAIEAQGYPDAPNRADFPSQILQPGETYRREIRFRFDIV